MIGWYDSLRRLLPTDRDRLADVMCQLVNSPDPVVWKQTAVAVTIRYRMSRDSAQLAHLPLLLEGERKVIPRLEATP
ncbi:unnamed protein product [Haemonchus placei]|uniref:MLTR_LBD domain-containing protein n=1 Tax=Haemonchus placei TaxID=6290 RepID=A0A0N4WAZ3_HAEPC|nr:unnamed protein product [Haemonchus placei]